MTGSTSLENVEAEGMKPVGFDTYSECVEKVLDGTVPAMSTDGTILAGYAAQNEGELKVVGEEFSEEHIGVGYSKDQPEMCQWIVERHRGPTRTAPRRRPSRRRSARRASRPRSRRDGRLPVDLIRTPGKRPGHARGSGPPRHLREEGS